MPAWKYSLIPEPPSRRRRPPAATPSRPPRPSAQRSQASQSMYARMAASTRSRRTFGSSASSSQQRRPYRSGEPGVARVLALVVGRERRAGPAERCRRRSARSARPRRSRRSGRCGPGRSTLRHVHARTGPSRRCRAGSASRSSCDAQVGEVVGAGGRRVAVQRQEPDAVLIGDRLDGARDRGLLGAEQDPVRPAAPTSPAVLAGRPTRSSRVRGCPSSAGARSSRVPSTIHSHGIRPFSRAQVNCVPTRFGLALRHALDQPLVEEAVADGADAGAAGSPTGCGSAASIRSRLFWALPRPRRGAEAIIAHPRPGAGAEAPAAAPLHANLAVGEQTCDTYAERAIIRRRSSWDSRWSSSSGALVVSWWGCGGVVASSGDAVRPGSPAVRGQRLGSR